MKELVRGKTVSYGEGDVDGKARVLLDSNEVAKFEQGEILVVRQTNPFFMSAVMKALAIITEVGGGLSHAAIISRELGIPCITGSKEATKKIQTGENIRISVSKGVIYGL